MPKNQKSSSCSDDESCECKLGKFAHNIQLQLSDSLGFPVPGTEFWVTLTILIEEPKITIQFPVINFQTGPTSPDAPVPPLVSGGYLYTSDGFLPKKVRPNDLVYRSYLVSSNDGMSAPFSFFQDPSTLPVPISGYLLQITNAGAIVIQAAGTFGNIIPPGPQIMLPTDISYIINPKIKLGKNILIDAGFTDTSQFLNPPNNGNVGFRDSHVNDAFDNILAWSWSSNANIADKTNGTTNVFVAMGKVKKNGTLKVKKPIQLSDLPPGVVIFDTAVAINRANKKNIVVSYGVENNAIASFIVPYRAVSFDGGKTWPVNGPINTQPTGNPSSSGDCRGVSADKFGNIWYCSTNFYDNFGNLQNQPFFAVSNDGVSFTVVYAVPFPPADVGNAIYDYVQFCFGGDGQGNYGLQFVVDYISFMTGDIYPVVGFIPITGLGQFGSVSLARLTSLLNVNQIADITASNDGRVWIYGFPNTFDAYSYIQSNGILFKSPGPIDQNYAGVWQSIIFNCRGPEYGLSVQDSQPGFIGYIPNSVKSILYDDKRQALYALFSAQFPDNSQDARIYFIISRDNGQTWSQPIDLETKIKNNRGFQSMALDPVTGNLIFGWYDGSNAPNTTAVQYFGAILTAKELDCLVNNIPLSNPLYAIPLATVASTKVSNNEVRKMIVKKKSENRRIKRPNNIK